jgi:hypothetical protein
MLHDMNLQAVVVNLRDVTERIEANKALKKGKRFFKKSDFTRINLFDASE